MMVGISTLTMWKWTCVRMKMDDKFVCVCVDVCAVDVTVISDQYSPLANKISEAPASERGHLGRGETHSNTHIQITVQYHTHMQGYTH